VPVNPAPKSAAPARMHRRVVSSPRTTASTLGTFAQSPTIGTRTSGLPGSPARSVAPKVTSSPNAITAVLRELDRLWRAYRRRPLDETRNRLVEHYQPLVRELVRRFAARLPKCVDRGDLDTAANVGLMSAIEGFDPERGVRFEAYCELRVKGAVLDELRHHDWLPRIWRARLELQKRTVERLRSESNREPNDEEVASAMEMPAEDYRHIFGLGLLDEPTSNPTDHDGEPSLGLEIVIDTHTAAPGEKLSRDEILRLVAQRLTGQEYRLVYLKYWEELSMREIGELMRLSESRVCKIHTRLLERLKDRFRVGADT